MNRRTLLGRFVFGAVAVLGCGMAAPKAEAAESRLAEGLPIKRGALTFDAMQTDCEARGCSISAVNAVGPGQWFVTHKTVPAENGSISQYLPFFQVDAWRRSLHGAAVRQTDLGTQIAEVRRVRGARPLFSTD